MKAGVGSGVPVDRSLEAGVLPRTWRSVTSKYFSPTHTEDGKKTSFMTSMDIYFYNVRPFGLKNAGSTYQRLVNMMFSKQIGQTMEVCIDDMLVKSLEVKDHISHLQQAFSTLLIHRNTPGHTPF